MSTALLICLVVAISDGDTLKARCEGLEAQQTIRLAEIDAPEKRQPFGERSKHHLSSLCYRQQAEIHPKTKDRNGRTVARVHCAGVDANAAMVRAGMAWAFTRYLGDPAIREFEVQAQTERAGLWSDAGPIAPWNWRRARVRGENAWADRASSHSLAQ